MLTVVICFCFLGLGCFGGITTEKAHEIATLVGYISFNRAVKTIHYDILYCNKVIMAPLVFYHREKYTKYQYTRHVTMTVKKVSSSVFIGDILKQVY